MVTLFVWLGWRNTWSVAAVFLVLIALPLVYALMRIERQPKSTDLPQTRHIARDWTRGEVLRDPVFWIMLSGVLAPAFIGTTIFFHQAYLIELRGWNKEAFASAFALMATMTVIFALTCGWMIDRFGAARILPFYLLPLACACMALAFAIGEAGIFIFMALLGISYGLSSTLFGAIWPEIYGTLHLGGIRSITVAAMVFSSALGPGISGLLIDLGVAYPDQIFAMGLYCLAASFVMLFVSRKLIERAKADS
jgi:MFS family permease